MSSLIIYYWQLRCSSGGPHSFCSPAEWLGLVDHRLCLLALCGLFVVVCVPGVVGVCEFALLGHPTHLLHLLLLHLLHIHVLLPGRDRGHYRWHSLDHQQDKPSDERIFKGHTQTTSNCKYTACDETRHHSIPRVVLLSVVDHQAIYRRKDSAPHSEWTTQEGCAITDVH